MIRWWGGLPEAFFDHDRVARRANGQLTTPCPKTTEAERQEATGWVRAALAAGQFRFYEGNGTYPKHLWYRDDSGQYWFGLAVNDTLGSYKGWPISEQDKRETFDKVV